MPFAYDADGKQYWDYSDRDAVIRWFSDTYRSAAEQLARRVEEYLFDTRAANYQNPIYLSWALAQFDHDKTGSGGPGHNREFDEDVALASPLVPSPDGTVIARRQEDSVPRIPKDQAAALKKEKK